MRRTPAPPALVLLLLLPLLPAAQGQTDALHLSELLPDPETGREFVELYNPTPTAIDLEGHRIEDAAGNGHTFGPLLLDPGARVVVWSGGDSDALGPAMPSSTVWNNGGDTATLLDPSGTVLDALSYGTPEVPAPPKGASLQRGADGTWRSDHPSPAAAPGEQVGTASATVEDVPATLRFESVPDRLRPGEAGVVTLSATDANGDAVSWTLRHGETLLATGEAGTHDVIVSFSTPETVVLTLSAGASETTTTLLVAEAALRISLPPGGVAFPPLPPGGGPVDATPFLIANDGTTPATPRIDVSDLRGPDTIPVAGHLHVGTRPSGDPDADWSWFPYDAPLTALPDLPAGVTVDVVLRLLDVPAPLAAGAYHTSFTVVP